MENKCVDAMIIDDALVEELQVQEAILSSAFQEMAIQDTSDDSIDHLILIDQSQRKKFKRPFSVADHGESSSSSSTMTTTTGGAGDFYCSICMETVSGALKFIVSSCCHAFCVCCIGQYVADKIGENTAHVRCPDPGCGDDGGGIVEPESCRGVVSSEVLDRWGFLLCEAAIVARRLHCPFRDCSEPLLTDSEVGGGVGGGVAEAECPSCHRLFCARCMVPWHDGVGCEEFQELGEDVMVRRLAGRERWQRCPQCRMYVEKSEGCMFMKCRCGCCFCYACASPMSKELITARDANADIVG